MPHKTIVKLSLCVIAGVTLLSCAHTDHAKAPAPTPAPSMGIADDEIRDVVNRVARHQLHPLKDGEYPPVQGANALQSAQAAAKPDGIAWGYPWGVALYGLTRSTDATGDKEVESFVLHHNQICSRYYSWLTELHATGGDSPELTEILDKAKIHGLLRLGNLDSCGAMGAQMLEGILRHPEQESAEEKVVVARIADWIVNKQDRLPDGTLWRSKIMGGTVWPDDLYMSAPFLIRYAKYTGDQKYLDDAANQIIRQAALEQDSDGLWFHGYFIDEKKHAPFKWGRGNGWVTVATVEVLSVLPENHPARVQLIEILRKQIEGLKKVQAPDGMWRQVLDKPELWEETSCTAMFAYGIARAVHRGWIDASNMAVARKAFAGIAKNVAADGTVRNTCMGTNISTDLNYYIERPHPDDDMHGRGPVMLAGTEILLAGSK
ncbi:MAG TPA: glycoside hydrolase family 88 protein [Terriglobales bacterium]|nr:glycoside hydrolase family 88 protein [Terriglobales bacterium]